MIANLKKINSAKSAKSVVLWRVWKGWKREGSVAGYIAPIGTDHLALGTEHLLANMYSSGHQPWQVFANLKKINSGKSVVL